MHDCNKFKAKMVDLLFECADGDERSRLLAEVAACKTCDSLYHSMSETLAVFDQVGHEVEHLGLDRDRYRATTQLAPVGVQSVIIE